MRSSSRCSRERAVNSADQAALRRPSQVVGAAVVAAVVEAVVGARVVRVVVDRRVVLFVVVVGRLVVVVGRLVVVVVVVKTGMRPTQRSTFRRRSRLSDRRTQLRFCPHSPLITLSRARRVSINCWQNVLVNRDANAKQSACLQFAMAARRALATRLPSVTIAE